MLSCLGFGSKCVGMINTLFYSTSTFGVVVNNTLSPCIPLHHAIREGFPLAPHLYVVIMDDLGYLLETSQVQGHIQGVILPYSSKMTNNHFAYDYMLSLHVNQEVVATTRYCVSLFFQLLGIWLSIIRLITG